MGDIFMEKIIEVEKNGWLQAPVENGVPYDGEAARDAEDAIKANEEQIAKGKEAEEALNLGTKPPRRRRRGVA